MYMGTLFIASALAVYLCISGTQERIRPGRIVFGGSILAATGALFWLMDFWGEKLWFESVGYAERFWTEIYARVATSTVGAAVALGLTWLLLWGSRRRELRYGAVGVSAALGVLWGVRNWETALMYLYRERTELIEPILDHDSGFYLFALPFYDAVYGLLLGASVVALVAAAIELFADSRRSLRPLLVSTMALGAALSVGRWLARYHLLYSDWGTVTGPGWTDVYVRLPALFVVALGTLLLAAVPLLSQARSGKNPQQTDGDPGRIVGSTGLVFCWGAIGVLWVVALAVLPALFQWLRVQPNEITLEGPFIGHNVRFTRQAFGLDQSDEREYPISGELTRDLIRNNEHLVSEIRLWDWRALDAVYEQFQEIRLYYVFNDVDIDRYHLGNRTRQVMVSAREMSVDALPSQSQTFVNRRFKYTHGYGVTLTPVSEFTPDGLPNLLVKDVPPTTSHPELEMDRPEIYYGELTDEPVYVNTREKEFDRPTGDENLYVHYSGSGGVLLSNWWRRLSFGWKFDGTRFLLSGYLTPESRVQFHRNIRDRVKTLAPFLTLDRDPYIVISEGRLYWILDAYTTSRRYPYSEALSFTDSAPPELMGVNYLRNSVKAVVDAFDGSVELYVFTPEDPVLRVWRNVYPSLFRDRESMPEALEQHIRYPEDLLLAQGLTYCRYHMIDPEVFYNQEDLWVRSTEKYYGGVQPVEPYYVMWNPPERDGAELTMMMPFSPKNRQVLIGWIAGLSAPGHYGELVAYKFPKEERILGPQQVETKIDQDRFLAGQLTLWDQRGSRVIRGNMLAIPIDGTLLYVEPIYLQAETAAYPELRLVALMHGDRLSYAETFDEALQGLFEESDDRQPTPWTSRGTEEEDSPWELGRQANEAFERYLQLLGEKKFTEAARELDRLEEILGGFRGDPGSTD